MGYKPVNQLRFYCICDFDCLWPELFHKDADQTGQGCTQLYVLYVITAHIEQLADCLGIIGFSAQPFKQYILGKDNGSAAYCHVVAEPLEFAAQAEQGLAGPEKELDAPPVPV
nr:hypothetical protein [uncultured Acetatifactor sp.]